MYINYLSLIILLLVHRHFDSSLHFDAFNLQLRDKKGLIKLPLNVCQAWHLDTFSSKMADSEFPAERSSRPQNVDWLRRVESHQNFITRINPTVNFKPCLWYTSNGNTNTLHTSNVTFEVIPMRIEASILILRRDTQFSSSLPKWQ